MLLVVSPAVAQTDALNCDDLSEAEEKAVFDADPSDPNGLDGNDNDGMPCEEDNTDNGSYVSDSPPARDREHNLLISGGPSDPPYPTMNDGRCPEEFPVKKDDGCYPAEGEQRLPDTGGASPALLPPAALLIAGGLAVGLVTRRR
jgi:hypothetical protein